MSKITRIEVDGISVEVIKKNIKNLNLYVLPPEGEVRLSVPRGLPDEEIWAFLSSKLEWIRKNRATLKGRPRPLPSLYVSGEEIYLFGKRYLLDVRHAGRSSPPVIIGKTVTITVRADSTPEQRAAYIDEWYRSVLEIEIEKLLSKWEAITRLRPSGWQIRKMKTRWGSCNTTTGKIRLNLQLAAYRPECLEYVILHELAHLKVRNHGIEFKAILDQYMPEWKEIKKLLNRGVSGVTSD